MGGIIQDFIFLDDFEERRSAAYHEAAHALRAHRFGIVVESIYLSLSPAGGTCVKLSGDPSDHSMWEHAQVALVGPIASVKYLREHPGLIGLIAFRDKDRTIGECEDDADLLSVIDRIRWTHDGVRVSFDQLTPDFYQKCELGGGWFGLDDFERAFDSIMTEHYNRYGRIPRRSTLLRKYREHEQIARTWVEENWPRICLIGWHTLQHEKITTRYTHKLPKKKFLKIAD